MDFQDDKNYNQFISTIKVNNNINNNLRNRKRNDAYINLGKLF